MDMRGFKWLWISCFDRYRCCVSLTSKCFFAIQDDRDLARHTKAFDPRIDFQFRRSRRVDADRLSIDLAIKPGQRAHLQVARHRDSPDSAMFVGIGDEAELARPLSSVLAKPVVGSLLDFFGVIVADAGRGAGGDRSAGFGDGIGEAGDGVFDGAAAERDVVALTAPDEQRQMGDVLCLPQLAHLHAHSKYC